jgi:hypothetical protein
MIENRFLRYILKPFLNREKVKDAGLFQLEEEWTEFYRIWKWEFFRKNYVIQNDHHWNCRCYAEILPKKSLTDSKSKNK